VFFAGIARAERHLRAARAPDREQHMEAFAHFVLKHRAAILAASALATLASAGLMSRLKVNADFDSYLSPTDPVIVRSRAVGQAFGSNHTAVALIESEDAFAPETLKGIARVSKAYEDLPGVPRSSA
jgi:predicted RND superfamily exporter protein